MMFKTYIIYFLQLLGVLFIFLFMTKCFVYVLMFLLMMLLLILLISDSSFFLIPPPWHTTWSREMTRGSAWHNCGSCVCCLAPPPFRRPSCLLFIFFLFFQDGLALITFTIEQPGSPHSRPGFPPSLCYICQAHGMSFACMDFLQIINVAKN